MAGRWSERSGGGVVVESEGGVETDSGRLDHGMAWSGPGSARRTELFANEAETGPAGTCRTASPSDDGETKKKGIYLYDRHGAKYIDNSRTI
mmetsp:Transcript_34140/g.100539  ORF Transcript_34140/g.100539 Transcript_34140/m.100539 type:complete len:92 (-) Transcript_34140:30-305(-)